jgi:hypothetical protein
MRTLDTVSFVLDHSREMSIELVLADPVNYTILKMPITLETLMIMRILTTPTLQSLVDDDIKWWWDHIVNVMTPIKTCEVTLAWNGKSHQ